MHGWFYRKKMIYAKIQIQVFVIFYVLILHHIINSKIRIKVPFRAMLFFNNLIDEIFSKICFKMNSFIWSFPRFDVLKVNILLNTSAVSLLNANAEVEKEIMHKKLIIFFIFIRFWRILFLNKSRDNIGQKREWFI